MKKILVAGSLNLDIVLHVAHIPAPGETILSRRREFHEGGKGGNQAVAAARLGAHIAMLGCVGQDEAGNMLISSLKNAGVDVSHIRRTPDAETGCAYIYVSDEGQNNIVVFPGANYFVDTEIIDQNLALIKGASYCVVQMEIPVKTLEHLCKVCAGLGVQVILNPAPAQPIDPEVLSMVDFIIPNETELQIMTGVSGDYEEQARELLRMGVKHVIVTLGEKGCLLADDKGTAYFPARKVCAVDTTAAGDAFIGGFTQGLAEGMSIEESIHFATQVAAFSTTRKGAQPSLGTKNEVEAFFEAGLAQGALK